MPEPFYPMGVRRSRIPKVKLDELGEETADVTVAALTKVGDEQDRGSEILLYGVTVGVTAYVGESENEKSDLVEDLIEQIQNFVSHVDNQCLKVNDAGLVVDLELPYVNDPIFNKDLLLTGIFQSITTFNYLVDQPRNQ